MDDRELLRTDVYRAQPDGVEVSCGVPVYRFSDGRVGSLNSHLQEAMLKMANDLILRKHTGRYGLTFIRVAVDCNEKRFARMLGVSTQQIHEWESGREPIPPHVVDQYHKLLG